MSRGAQDSFYHRANSLVGIYRDQVDDCSHLVTLDLSKYADDEPEDAEIEAEAEAQEA